MKVKKRMLPTPVIKKQSSPAPVDEDFCQRLRCAVCYDTLRSPTYQVVPCSHKFCETCIKTWRYTHFNRQCPMCCKPACRISRDHFVDTMLDQFYEMNPGAPPRENCPPWEGSESGDSDDESTNGDDDSDISDTDIEVDVVHVTEIPRRAARGANRARRLPYEMPPTRLAAAFEELRSLTAALERSIDLITLGADDEEIRVTVTPEPRPPAETAAERNRRSVPPEPMDTENDTPPVLNRVLTRPRREVPPYRGLGHQLARRVITANTGSRRGRISPSTAAAIRTRLHAQQAEIEARSAALARRTAASQRGHRTAQPPPIPRVRAAPPPSTRAAQPASIPRTRGNNHILPSWNSQVSRSQARQQPAPVLRRSARLQALRAQ